MPKNFVSNKDESVRMFESNFLEFFSKVHWTVPLFVYIPIISFLNYSASVFYNAVLFNILMFNLFGLFVWTLTEYILHRFIFHYEPKKKWSRKIHWTFHGVHHDYPQDSKRLVMPPSVSLPLATGFYFLFGVFLADGIHHAFFSGFLVGYLAYDMIHYSVHHFVFKNKLLLKLKSHHMKHHFIEPNKGYGVSQPIWDIVFGTMFEKKK